MRNYPPGALVDKVGPRILLAAGLALWSVAQACGGLVSSLRQFVVTRIVLGIGEAPQFPAGARVVSNWYHMRERGLPTGVFNSSSSLGPALAPPLLTLLMAAFGWRRMFFIMGALGLFAALAWYVLYRDPRRAGLSEDELLSLRAGEQPSRGDVSFAQWLRLFRHRTTWGMVLGFAGALYLVWLYLTWLPGLSQGATPHEHVAGRIRSLGPVYLRIPGLAGRRSRLRSAGVTGRLTDQ